MQWIATFFAGFAIGFAREWRLTLFLIAVTPILAIVAGVFSKVIDWRVIIVRGGSVVSVQGSAYS